MRLYIASHSQQAAKDLKVRLEFAGHSVIARWITVDVRFGAGLSAYTDEERAALALMDEEDVRAATDGLVLIAEPDGRPVPGGKHVETGIALALCRPVFVLGRRENLFHWHRGVTVLDSVDQLIVELGRRHRTLLSRESGDSAAELPLS